MCVCVVGLLCRQVGEWNARPRGSDHDTSDCLTQKKGTVLEQESLPFLDVLLSHHDTSDDLTQLGCREHQQLGRPHLFIDLNDASMMHRPNARRAQQNSAGGRPWPPHRLRQARSECRHLPRDSCPEPALSHRLEVRRQLLDQQGQVGAAWPKDGTI